jgi:signal transduction histidine kinase
MRKFEGVVVMRTGVLLHMLFLLAALLHPPLSAQDTRQKNILVLLSYHATLPWVESVLKGLEEVRREHGGNIQYYVENMDAIRLGGAIESEKWADYLAGKYRSVRMDAVIAESDVASQFVAAHAKELFGSIPVVANTGLMRASSPNIKVLNPEFDRAIDGTIDMALKQNPGTRNVYIVQGMFQEAQVLLSLLLPRLRQIEGVDVKILEQRTIGELEQAVAALPEQSIVFYTLVASDRSGHTFTPKYALGRIARVSDAPIYVFYSSLMGNGAVGGHLVDGETTARQMAQALFDFLDTGHFKTHYGTLRTYADWNAMQRYGIEASSLPAGARLLNKPLSIFETHLREVVATLLFIALLVAMVGLLFVFNMKLKRANTQLTHEKEERMLKERLLIRQSRLAAMGEMIGNIAHQWRQPLNTLSLLMITVSTKYRKGTLEDSDMRTFEKKSNMLIQKMSSTIDDFRNYFRPDKEKIRFDAAESIGESLEFLHDSFANHNIAMVFERRGTFEVTGFKNELQQVLINVLNNAKDAIISHAPQQGKVTVGIREEQGKQVVISIQDNGGGIDEAILDKVFAPYFTTKFHDQGTGIGLYMSKMIVEDSMEGTLTIENSGGGALCSIAVPKGGDHGTA